MHDLKFDFGIRNFKIVSNNNHWMIKNFCLQIYSYSYVTPKVTLMYTTKVEFRLQRIIVSYRSLRSRIHIVHLQSTEWGEPDHGCFASASTVDSTLKIVSNKMTGENCNDAELIKQNTAVVFFHGKFHVASNLTQSFVIDAAI